MEIRNSGLNQTHKHSIGKPNSSADEIRSISFIAQQFCQVKEIKQKPKQILVVWLDQTYPKPTR